MLALISSKFSISVRPEILSLNNGIQFYARYFHNKETIDLGFFDSESIEIQESFCQIALKLQTLSTKNNYIETDIVTILKKTWWQYKDNIYNIHLNFSKNNNESSFLLFIMEHYVQRFSMEMLFFIQNLNDFDKNTIDNFISMELDINDIYYSELQDIKLFFDLNNNIQKGNLEKSPIR